MLDPPPIEAQQDVAYDRPEVAALGSKMRTGIAWKAASQLVSQGSRMAMTVILAHLLTPSDFGLAGLVLVFSGLIQLLTDVGFSASIVQLPTLTEEDRSTAFWTGLAVSSLFFVLAYVAAPYVADFYGKPSVRWMFVAVCSTLIIGALCTTQASILWRRMEFRALEIRGMAAAVVASVVGIAAAAGGLGAWSLILQALAMSIASTLAIWLLSPWKPRFIFSLTSLRRMGLFSANIFFARFAYYGDRNADNLLVGRFLGTSALGLYSIGYSVILIPVERLLWPIQSVLTPAMASMQDDVPRMRALWLRGVRLTATLMFPSMVGVILVCPDFVTVVLGTKWAAATVIIQILAWVALIQSLSALTGAVVQSLSRTGLLLRLSLFAFALDLGAFVLGLHWGVRGVAAAYAIANTAVIVPVSLVLVTRLLGEPLASVAAELKGVVEATTVMAITVFLVRHGLVSAGLAAAPRLVLTVAAGAAVYLLMCFWRDRRVFTELRPRRLQELASA
jgi:O-antigen/teichoic acid export membrane protein